MTKQGELADDTLVARVQSGARGDTRAFESLLGRYQGRILANCRHIAGSADAEDLAQEVFVKAFFALARFEQRSSFKTWLFRIKINHCLNFIAKKRGKHFLDVDDPVNEAKEELKVAPTADRDLERADERTRIKQVLDAMPDGFRIPLLMRDLDGLSYQEIAEALGLGLSAIKMRIKRGRADFRLRYDALKETTAA